MKIVLGIEDVVALKEEKGLKKYLIKLEPTGANVD